MDYKKLRDTRNSSNPFAQRLGIFVEEIGANASGYGLLYAATKTSR